MKQKNNYSIPFDSIDDLFSIPKEAEGHTVIVVPLKDLFPYSNHPFRVIDDEKMDELVDSITENGVLEPAIVRSRPFGGYEIISGHRRKRACEKAGLDSMPVIVKELSDDEAAIVMVDSNNQPVHIDMMNVCRGPTIYDVSRTYFLLEGNKTLQANYLELMGYQEKDIIPYLRVISQIRETEENT